MMSTAPSSGSSAVPPPLVSGRRRFAPLDPERENVHGAPELRGVIFDVDGTLCLPQNYMFREMRSALSIPKSVDILTHIRELPTRPERAAAVQKIQTIERRAMTQQRPQPHLRELMEYLEAKNIRKGLCTRNFPAPVEHLRAKFLDGIRFDGVVTRDTPGIRAKPEADGLWMIVEGWNQQEEQQQQQKDSPPPPPPSSSQSTTTTTAAAALTSPSDPTSPKGPVSDLLDSAAMSSSPSSQQPPDTSSSPANPYHPLPPPHIERLRHRLGAHVMMVGDSMDDMLAARAAGAAAVLLVNDENAHLVAHAAVDRALCSLAELVDALERGFEGEER